MVDTPGTNCIEDNHQQITESFVPLADLIIFVLPAPNPWGASAWNFLDRVAKDWGKKVVLCLQQSDRCSPEEIRLSKQKILTTCRDRYAREFPLEAVSAKESLDGNDPESGLSQLRELLFHRLAADAGLLEQERSTLTSAQALLEQIEKVLQRSRDNLAKERQSVLSHDRDTYEQRERTRHKFQNILHNLDHRYRLLTPEGAIFLRQQARLAPTLKSFFKADETSAKLSRRVAVRLLEESRSALSGAAAIVEDDLQRLWRQSLPDSDLPDWKKQRKEMMDAVEKTLRNFVDELSVEPTVSKKLRLRKSIIGTGGIAAIATASASTFLSETIQFPFLGTSAAIFLLSLGAGHLALRQGTKAFGTMIETSRDELQQRVLQTLDLHVNQYFQLFLSEFSQKKRSLERRSEDRAPSLQQVGILKAKLADFLSQGTAGQPS